VKKVLAVVIAIVMMFAMTIPVLAKNTVDNAQLTWKDGFGFHCNAVKGNGATDVINLNNGAVVAKGNQKNVFGTNANPINLQRVESTTTWNLLTNDIECATCGRIDWITYSNNNGVINGKNIQANHSGSPRYIAEVSIFWTTEVLECEIDCEAEDCTFECDLVCDCGECEPCTCNCEDHNCIVCNCAVTANGFVETKKVIVPIDFSYDFNIAGFDLVNITDAKGNAVTFPVSLPAAKASYSFTFNFVASGDCVCTFGCIGDCNCECDPTGGFFRDPDPHVCIAACDNCKNGVGSNHENCERNNNENNTNYFCIDCGKKLGRYHGNHGWQDANNNPINYEFKCGFPVIIA